MFTVADYILLLSTLASLVLALIVLRQKPRKSYNILFFLFILAMLGWTFANFLLDATASVHSLSLFAARVTAFSMSWAPWFLLLFIKSFVKEKLEVSKWLLVAGFVFAGCFSLLSFTPLIVSDVDRTIYPVEVVQGPLYLLLITYIVVVALWALGELVLRYIGSSDEKRVQLLYLVVGSALMIITALITNVLFVQFFKNADYVRLGAMSPLLLVVFVTYAVTKHRLFNAKVLATQILVAALIIITTAQLIASQDVSDLVFRLVVLMLVSVTGLVLVKSVVKEHDAAQRIKGLNTDLMASNARLEKLTVQLKQANQHLKELMDIKTEFLHIASHQLRTPLTGLRGYLEMQANGEFDNIEAKKRHDLHRDMLNAANQLNTIVNDLLDAMELEGGSLNFTWEPVQLEDMIGEIMEQLKPNYEKKGLALEFVKPSPLLPKVDADAGYLRQVFLNMVDNAEKYTLKGGVTISAKVLDDKVEVAVKDTGIGIDPAEKDKLFGKFIRGSRSQQIHTDGSGLGLFIMRKIATEHGGEIVLESDGVDKGTTVKCILPIKRSK